mgnify:CR=1 FL=1
MSASEVTERLRGVVGASNVRLVAATFLGIYLAFLAVSVILGFDLNGTVNTLRRITFLAAAYALLALALNLQWGYAGLFNIGVAGFMAVAVYTMAILAGSPSGTPPGLGLSLWVAAIGGMVAAAIVGAVAALPALRLKADYLAIVTLALGEIIRISVLSRSFASFTVAGVSLGTGGGQGISIPDNPVRSLYYLDPSTPTSGTTPFGSAMFGFFDSLSVPFFSGTGVNNTVVVGWTYALVLLVFVGLFYVLLRRIGNSPFGRVLKAIREDELAAQSLGKDTRAFKIQVFMLGCALMGLAAILWQGSQGYTSPGEYLPIQTFYVFIALIIGGAGSNTGSIIGGAVFVAFLFEGPNFVKRIVENLFSLGNAPNTIVDAVAPLAALEVGPLITYVIGNIEILRPVFLGVVLVYLMQRRPDGLLGHRKEIAAAVDLTERGESDG